MTNFKDIKFLIKLSRKMNEQDKRGTSYPLFVVYDKVKHYVHLGGWDDPDGKERKEDQNYVDLCEGCKRLYDEDEVLPDECDDCDDECFLHFKYNDEILEDHGIYFTAEACNEYIKRRRYEFNEPYSYAISAYWSNEMRRVMEIICKITGDGKGLK